MLFVALEVLVGEGLPIGEERLEGDGTEIEESCLGILGPPLIGGFESEFDGPAEDELQGSIIAHNGDGVLQE